MEWTEANATAADLDGWVLNTNPKRKAFRLQFKVSCFTSFPEMYGHLVRRGLEQSPLHLKALALVYADNRREFLAVMAAVPANKTGTLAKTIITMARMSGLTTGEP